MNNVIDIGTIVVSSQTPLTIRLCGEFDISNIDQLRAVVVGITDQHDVVVEASGVTFASAALLNCLVELSGRLDTAGGSLGLRGQSRVLCRLIEITDTTGMFKC